METATINRLLAPIAIGLGALITVALVAIAVVVPGYQNLVFDACVTFTLTAVGSCAYVVSQPHLMDVLKV